MIHLIDMLVVQFCARMRVLEFGSSEPSWLKQYLIRPCSWVISRVKTTGFEWHRINIYIPIAIYLHEDQAHNFDILDFKPSGNASFETSADLCNDDEVATEILFTMLLTAGKIACTWQYGNVEFR